MIFDLRCEKSQNPCLDGKYYCRFQKFKCYRIMMPEHTSPHRSKLSIIAFGDSITEGTYGGALSTETYPFVLEQMLVREKINAKVNNEGVPGETAPEGLIRFERDVIALKPDMVLIMYGANDAFIPPGNNAPAVSPADFSEAIRKMVNRLADMSILPVLMTTTPVSRLDFFMADDAGFLERIKLSLETHIKEVRKIAQEGQILLIDHYKTWLEMDKLKEILKAYLPDGVHPNAEGNFLLATITCQALINEIRK